MPDDLKEDIKKKDEHHKKFKTVTEELTNPALVAESEEQNAPIIESEVKTEDSHEQKPTLGVIETKNITPEHSVKHESGIFLKFFLVTFLATLLALALGGGVYVYLTGVNNDSEQKQNSNLTPIATEIPIPIVSPSANIDLSTFKVSVLNGNGGIGVAGALKNIIEKAGFKVSNLANADNFSFTDTVIQVKPSVSDNVVTTLKDSLSSTYSVKVGDALDSQSAYDIIITVGSK